MNNKTYDNLHEKLKQTLEEIANSTRRSFDNQNRKRSFIFEPSPGKQQVLVVDTTSRQTMIESIENFPNDCFVGYSGTDARQQVYKAIDKERDHQDQKWGADKQQSLPGFLLVMQGELNEAIEGWQKNKTDRHAPLNEVVQLAATAVACLEKYGTTGSAKSTDDISQVCPPK